MATLPWHLAPFCVTDRANGVTEPHRNPAGFHTCRLGIFGPKHTDIIGQDRTVWHPPSWARWASTITGLHDPLALLLGLCTGIRRNTGNLHTSSSLRRFPALHRFHIDPIGPLAASLPVGTTGEPVVDGAEGTFVRPSVGWPSVLHARTAKGGQGGARALGEGCALESSVWNRAPRRRKSDTNAVVCRSTRRGRAVRP